MGRCTGGGLDMNPGIRTWDHQSQEASQTIGSFGYPTKVQIWRKDTDDTLAGITFDLLARNASAGRVTGYRFSVVSEGMQPECRHR